MRTSSHRHGEQVDSLDAHGKSSCMMANMADLEANDALLATYCSSSKELNRAGSASYEFENEVVLEASVFYMSWLWRLSASSPPLSLLLPSPSPILVIHWPFCCKTALRRSFFSEENDHQHFIPSSAFRSVSRVSRSTISTDSDPFAVDEQRQSLLTRVSALACPLAVAIPVQHFLSIASVTLLSQSAMSFWTCPACTFVNQGGSSICDMCEQTKKSSARGSAPFLSLNASQQDNASKWGCRACTFLNKDSDNRCDICGTPKSSIALDSFPEIDSTLDDDVEGGENRGTTFWPLRSCTGSLPESQESSQKHVNGSSPSTSTVPFPTQERAQPADRKRNYQEDGEAVLSNDFDCGKSSGVSYDILRNLHFEKMQRSMQSQAGSTAVLLVFSICISEI
ncbi:hypothetical protein L7F22_031880 [Adiantum nelumboides]|nr:hypothetical protein [Adiantum nelumboides]